MLGLNETAALYARLGRGGGRPVYDARGVAFRCRSEPARSHAARGDAIERGGDVRIFACGVNARPGDRVELREERYVITAVRYLRGPAGIHHLELTARAEGAR